MSRIRHWEKHKRRSNPEADDPRRRTGPRTPQGKARSARNARRHGLAVPIRADPFWRDEVLAIEQELAETEPHARRFAGMAAEAIVELRRIFQARATMIGNMTGEVDIAVASRMIAAMVKLDRYEGRAYAKKRKALTVLSCP